MTASTVPLKEAATRFGVHYETMRRHLHGNVIRLGDESLQVIRVGRYIKVPVAELDRLLGEREAAS